MNLDSKVIEIKSKLASLSGRLLEKLNDIFQAGIPNEADKIVIWIPLGHRYNLSFTYMTNDANETEGYYSQLSALDYDLEHLIKDVDFADCEYLNKLSKLVDLAVAEWLKAAIEKSDFSVVGLHKVMAINNACAYFDLNSLELLEEEDMWE